MMINYNENLIFENNEGLMEKVQLISKHSIVDTIKSLSKSVVSIDVLREEMYEQLKMINAPLEITGENIKCFFAINKNGTNEIWNNLLSQNKGIFNEKTYPLYENILEYIDDMLDTIDFDDLFEAEINELQRAS